MFIQEKAFSLSELQWGLVNVSPEVGHLGLEEQLCYHNLHVFAHLVCSCWLLHRNWEEGGVQMGEFQKPFSCPECTWGGSQVSGGIAGHVLHRSKVPLSVASLVLTVVLAEGPIVTRKHSVHGEQ